MSKAFRHVEPLERRALLTVAFGTPQHVAVDSLEGGILTAPAIGDFDGDGKADLVIGNANGDPAGTTNITFAKGNGDGTFTKTGPVLTPGLFTGQPAAGDFNGDDKLDVAVADQFDNLIRVLLGNGNGTFQAPVNVTVGTAPGNVFVGNFNGDNFDDVIVNNRGGESDRGNDTLSVILGGASGLGTPTTVNVGDDPASVAVVDLNGDSKLDVIVGNGGGIAANSGSIMTLFGNGDGTFDAPVTTTGPRGVSDVADFNGDSKLDVVVSVAANGVATILSGNGDGTFANVAPPAGQDQFLAVARDFDGDGKVDLAATGVTTDPGDDTRQFLSIFPGNGDGTFATKQDTEIQGAAGISAGDFAGDSKVDLALASFVAGTGPRVSTLVNQSTAGPGPGPGTGPDLTAELVGNVPSSVIAGTTKGRFTVRVRNASADTNMDRTAVAVRLVASTDGTFDTGDTEIATVTKNLKINAGKQKNVKLNFTYPTVAADGAFNVIAVVDSGNAVAEANEANNTAASASQVTIAAPFVDLTGTVSRVPATLRPGRNGAFQLSIQNLGNVPARGTIPVVLTASTDNALGGTDDVALGTANVRINVAANKTKRATARVAIPAGLAAGSYFVIAQLNQGGTLTESNTGNNTAVSTTQTTV